MVTGAGSSPRIPREQALTLTVGEVMIPSPKTFRADVGVGEVRRAFGQSNQRLALLVDGSEFRGAIDRDSLDPDALDTAPAAPFARRDIPTVTPNTPVADAVELLERNREPRLVVLDDEGRTLCGLLCFNPGSASFCVH